MSPSEPSTTALPSHRINLINEDDAGRIALRFHKEVTNAAGPDTYKHFHKFRSCNGEERHPRLAGHSTREKRLPGTRRTNEQNPLWNFCPEVDVLLRVLEKIHHLHQIFFCFLGSCNIFKTGFHLLCISDAGTGLPEGERTALAPCNAPEQPDNSTDNENEKQEIRENGEKEVRRFPVLNFHNRRILRIVPPELRHALACLFV